MAKLDIDAQNRLRLLWGQDKLKTKEKAAGGALRRTKDGTAAVREQVREMVKAGAGYVTIIKELHVGASTVSAIRKEMGVEYTRKAENRTPAEPSPFAPFPGIDRAVVVTVSDGETTVSPMPVGGAPAESPVHESMQPIALSAVGGTTLEKMMATALAKALRAVADELGKVE